MTKQERHIRIVLEDIAWESEQDPHAERELAEEREALEAELLRLILA
jgi:hypothetical protein